MKRTFLIKGLILITALTGIFLNKLIAQDLTSAILLTKSEQYDKAGAMLKEIIQKDPSNSKAYFFLGENTLLNYFADTISNPLNVATSEAKEDYQKGVDANPNDPLNYIGLAKVAFYLDDDKTADEMRAKASSLLLPFKNLRKINPPAPEYAFALAKIAESYIKDGQVDTSLALPLMRKALTIDKNNADIYLIAGDIYMLMNDGTKAIEYYNLAQFADPERPTPYMKIGYVYVRATAYKAAIANFQQAINLDPDYVPVYRELGQLYYKLNNYELSKQNYMKYLELSEGNIPAMTKYVNSLFYAGDYDEVIKYAENILAVDPSRGYLNRLAGYSYYEKKNPDYAQALSYMYKLFKTVQPDFILMKDHYYTARIIMKKDQDLPKMMDTLSDMEENLQNDQAKYNTSSTAAKAKLKPALDKLKAETEKLKSEVDSGNKELDRGFQEYNKVLETRPGDRGVLSEMASNYYTFKRYNSAARTWAQLLDPEKFDPDAYLRVGRAFYVGENYKSADSIFSIIIQKSPDYLPAYLNIARTNSKMDPDFKTGLARPQFLKVIKLAQTDSLKNMSDMREALLYLGYYYYSKDDLGTSKDYYNRLIALDPGNKDNKISGYSGIGMIEAQAARNEKTNEGRLPFLARSAAAYNQILALDPDNANAKTQLSWVHDFENTVRKGIDPNEIRGLITDESTGKPIPFASVRVKDTAAENLTNSQGTYKFIIPNGSETLIISAKGYQSKEIPITRTRVYNVSLSK